MIPESEISEWSEYDLKSKIGNISVNGKIREEHYVKINEIDPYFYEHYEKKNFDKDGHNHILFKIDIYFPEYNLAAEIDQKGHTDRYLVAENKRQEALEKKLGCTFIRINTSKEGHDPNYEIGRIQTFTSRFKNRQLRKLEKESNKKIKELEDEIKIFLIKLNHSIDC